MVELDAKKRIYNKSRVVPITKLGGSGYEIDRENNHIRKRVLFFFLRIHANCNLFALYVRRICTGQRWS